MQSAYVEADERLTQTFSLSFVTLLATVFSMNRVCNGKLLGQLCFLEIQHHNDRTLRTLGASLLHNESQLPRATSNN